MDAPTPLPASVTPASPAPTTPPRRSSPLPWLLALFVLMLAGGLGWSRWHVWQGARAATASSQQQQLESVQRRLDTLRRDQRALAARLRQATDTNRVLRNELLGIAQRAALLEDSLDRLADTERSSPQAMRLDDVEWLLAQGQQRLQLTGDLASARHAYALAAQRLDGIADPGYLDLRQTLAQERAALEALGADPRTVAMQRLDVFGGQLSALPLQEDADPLVANAPWWRRILGRIVDVRRSRAAIATDPDDRDAGFAALQLELSLARASAERRDTDGYRAALQRADAWLQRLWPPSTAQRLQRRRLRDLRMLPLTLQLPTMGSSLEQLRGLRESH